MLSRRAATLIELLVALTLVSIVLGSATASVLRQQRTHARIAVVSGADAQIRAATSVLASQLSLLDAAAGDIAPGGAGDTSLQIRAPIAAALACDRSIGSVTLLPQSESSPPFGGTASLPRSGDTLWWLGDSAWNAARIGSVRTVAAVCPAPISFSGEALNLTFASSPDTVPAGAALRITRQTRYSLYRSRDAGFQLGFREWVESSASFSAPQPIAGPILLGAGERRSGFRYFDKAAQELAPANGGLDATRVARIRITIQSLVASGNRGQDSIRSDSIDVALHGAREP